MTLGLEITFSYTIKIQSSPGQVAQLVEASSHTPKGCRFGPQSGHIPKLGVQYLVRESTEGT